MNEYNIVQSITTNDAINQAIIELAKKSPLDIWDNERIGELYYDTFKDELDLLDEPTMARLRHYFNSTHEQLVVTDVTLCDIQTHVSNIDGEIGINEANVAINALIESSLQSPSDQLDDFASQKRFLGNVDTMIGELMLFRATLADALDKGDTMPDESKFENAFRDEHRPSISNILTAWTVTLAYYHQKEQS